MVLSYLMKVLNLKMRVLRNFPLMETAKETGNIRVFGSVAAGALLSFFNIDISF